MRTMLKNICGFGMAAVMTLSLPVMAQQKALYERLGGKGAITAVVDEFVNPQRLAAFKGKLVDQICAASGGPCTYTGKNMKDAHAGMGITGAEFDALVGDLVGALDKFKVPEKEKGELLGALGPMKTDIVTKK
jgi:hemoglobin